MEKAASMQAFKVEKVEFTNAVQGQKKIELGFSYSYNVKYSKQNTCIGEFVAKVTDKSNPDEFGITVTAVGVFSFKPGSLKERLHIETYNELFPHVRAFVTTLTANAGIPPIIIPFIDISNKEIYRFEMGKEGKKPSADDFVMPDDLQ